MPDRVVLKGLTAEAFASDADHWALDKLKRVPVIPTLVSKFYEHGIDRWMYCQNMANSVRCGPNQYKTLYNIMRDAAATLDMPEPELYLTCNPYPNAWTYGVERPYITLRSSLVDTLTDDQLHYLIGHELGHIKAGHVLYLSLAWFIAGAGVATFGLSEVALLGFSVAYYEWSRQAEYTADRAGLLASQNLNDSIDSLIRLTGGKTRFSEEMSREHFMEQARAYQDFQGFDAIAKALLFLVSGYQYSHPMPVARVQQLERWHQSGGYDRILAGDFTRESSKKEA